jgi:hypothetical protein
LNQVIHVFTDVFMGLSHAGLSEILKRKTGRERTKSGEFAVFVNRGWTACKVFTEGTILYYREPNGYITVEDIKRLPAAFGGKRFGFAGNGENTLLKAFVKKFGEQKRLKAVV